MAQAPEVLDASRARFLQESLEASQLVESRWGYFGLTGPLAIGDNSLGQRTQRMPPPADDAPPNHNVKTNPIKKGATVDVYFSFQNSICLDDPFIDRARREKKDAIWMLDPEAKFRPPGKVTYSTNKLGYEYKEHMTDAKDPKDTYAKYKDDPRPKNFYTMPGKRGGCGVLPPGVLFGNGEEGVRTVFEYVEDDYDSAKKIRCSELQDHRAKCAELPMRSRVYGNCAFQPDSEVYDNAGVPVGIPREMKDGNYNRYAHEMPFHPSNPMKKGFNSCMQEFPAWMEDPIPHPKPKRADPDAPVVPAWRPCHPRAVANPMPSITCSTHNMRKERPASFMRPSLSMPSLHRK